MVTILIIYFSFFYPYSFALWITKKCFAYKKHFENFLFTGVFFNESIRCHQFVKSTNDNIIGVNILKW